ncbi:MAG: hypothetical protein ACTHMT_03280 [Verrucomicrobiota bacterium]
MKFLLLIFCNFAAGCQGPGRAATRDNNELARRLAYALEVNSDASMNHFFSPDQLEQLKQYKLVDHLALPNLFYYDRVWSVEAREMRRSYLNESGDIAREAIISLPESQFWKPIQALADYYEEFHRLPAGSYLAVPSLEGEVAAHSSNSRHS